MKKQRLIFVMKFNKSPLCLSKQLQYQELSGTDNDPIDKLAKLVIAGILSKNFHNSFCFAMLYDVSLSP